MNATRVGAAFRAVRLRLGRRQEDVARAAGVHRSTVSLIERGHWERLSMRTIVRVAEVLEIRIDVTARWRGGDLDRLLNSAHSQLHEAAARLLGARQPWLWQPEVSFSTYGERGVIDILAFHPPTGALLVIELKTEIVDVQEMVGTFDRKLRLAPRIASERGWPVSSVSGWVLVADTRSNRRRLHSHEAMLRAAFPLNGHAARTWLRRPAGVVRVISFMSAANAGSTSHPRRAVKRVRCAAWQQHRVRPLRRCSRVS